MPPKKASSLSVYLRKVLEIRKQRNPKYSLRAFARDLGISPGRLSDFVADRRTPGKHLSERMAEALKSADGGDAEFLGIVKSSKNQIAELGGAHFLPEDEFSLVANWEHFAILMLMGTDNFSSDAVWIAERLQTSKTKVLEALERLERLNLVKQDKGRMRRLKTKVSTTHEIPSAVLRESHRQLLEQAIFSLQHDDVSVRDITSITIPADPNQLLKAKKHIRAFRRKMAKLLEGEYKSEVYNLNIQLVPVTKVKMK